MLTVMTLSSLMACSDKDDPYVDPTPVDPEPVDPTEEYDEAYYAEHATISSQSSEYETSSDKSGVVSFGVEGGEVVIYVDCGVEWTVENNNPDLFAASANVSDGTLLVTAEENLVESELAGSFTLYTAESLIEFATVSVRQSAYVNPRALILEYTMSGSGTIMLPLSGTVDCTVNWGDGSDVQAVTGTLPTHTYESAGTYDVSITGLVSELSSNKIDTGYSSHLTKVVQWGNVSLGYMEYAFQNCYNLKSIPRDTNGGLSAVLSMWMAFYNCSSLETIEAGAFDYCKNVSSFYSAFGYCSKLSSLPEGLFSACTGTSNFQYVLYECPSLGDLPAGLFAGCSAVTSLYCAFQDSGVTSVPEGFLDDCVNVTDIRYMFSGCSSLKSIPDGLFDNCLEIAKIDAAFQGCGSLQSVPAGLFKNCTKLDTAQRVFQGCSKIKEIPDAEFFGDGTNVFSASYIFYGCSSLESVPAGLFDTFTTSTYFECSFQDCTSLKSVPAGLFDKCTAVKYMENLFYGCSSFESIPEGLFDNCTEVLKLEAAFAATNISAIPSGLFDNCRKVTSFYGVFDECSNLREIPSKLFDNCTAVTDFSYAFNMCTKLTSIPTRLFTYNTEVTDFSYCFCWCTSLTSIPARLFDNCTKVKDFSYAFSNCTAVTGESPYTEVGGTKVHLYERSSYPSSFTAPTTTTKCFYGCIGLSDYSSIPLGWL